jgi:GDPmannose 4,6-dehydratase
VFTKLDLDYRDFVQQDQKYMRPEELPYLRGDSTRIKTELSWKPQYTFYQLMDEMIDHWMNVYKSQQD